MKQKIVPTQTSKGDDNVHSSRQAEGEDAAGAGSANAPDGGSGEAESDGEGRLIATELRNLMRKDLRDLVRPEDIAEAEQVARRLGAARPALAPPYRGAQGGPSAFPQNHPRQPRHGR